MKKVIAFAGSNSSSSINLQLVKHAASLLEGVEVEIMDLRKYDTPIYSADLEKDGIPKSIHELVAKIAESDAYIIGTPEHNGSMTAFFKNLVDWMSRVERSMFGNKPALLLSTSGGPRGAAGSLADLQNKMKYFAGDVIATYSLGSFYDNFNQEGETIKDEGASKELRAAVEMFKQELNK